MNDIVRVFKEKNALLEGHFLLSSGLHSPQYIQCALVLQYPEIADEFGEKIARQLQSMHPTIIVSPALGGIVIGQSVAKALSVRSVFTERHENRMVLRRGFSISAQDRAVVIEDVITTGKSTGEVCGVVQHTGATVVAVGCIINRSTGQLPFAHPLVSLARLPVTTFEARTCPLCKAGRPVVKPGSRDIR
ncbi:MAG: orotate phosphoribosyltransferase [Elusimicrobia bacterium]|nr:orotate phosphoribosyltransferase [Elusimicrobiota bacterium]MBD3412382.1 orotate phosphoribosyltransferase [Elusimicrobiota bacterium]